MGNQYSITVSEESHNILKHMKKNGYMTSRAVDVAIRMIGIQGLTRLIRMQKAFEKDFEEGFE